MATFGNTNIGANATGGGSPILVASAFAAPADGTITKISWYGASDVADNAQVAIYSDVSGSASARLAVSGSVTTGTSLAWIDFTISLAITNGTIYWLAFVVQTQNYSAQYDAGTAAQTNYTTVSPWPPPSSFGTPNTLDRAYSVYATYTTSGGGVTWLPVTRVVQGQTFDAIDSGFKPPR